MIHKTEK